MWKGLGAAARSRWLTMTAVPAESGMEQRAPDGSLSIEAVEETDMINGRSGWAKECWTLGWDEGRIWVVNQWQHCR